MAPRRANLTGDQPSSEPQFAATKLARALQHGHRPLQKPFSEGPDILRWLEKYEANGRLVGLDDEGLTKQLGVHLEGLAEQWYRTNAMRGKLDNLSWTELRQLMEKVFLPFSRKMALRKEIFRSQRSDEKVAKFVAATSEACAELGVPTDETIQSIIAGLLPQYQRKVSHQE